VLLAGDKARFAPSEQARRLIAGGRHPQNVGCPKSRALEGAASEHDPNGATTAAPAGTPRYGWSGKHETDRNFAAGKGSGTTVVATAKHGIGPYVNEQDFSLTYETIDWSQARYNDYGFIALDVTPAAPGQRTTMVLRFINEQGRARPDGVLPHRLRLNPGPVGTAPRGLSRGSGRGWVRAQGWDCLFGPSGSAVLRT
jgi:hypothetical protein